MCDTMLDDARWPRASILIDAACCGSDHVDIEAPRLLAGKSRLTKRLGTGGAGEAYVARDLRLQGTWR